ncbi:MAG: hypothetical protein M1812_000640 [Candelaria pacifica]|nr:MAG: hypothetical protein M1812_000640 [Candelaria pacifica]
MVIPNSPPSKGACSYGAISSPLAEVGTAQDVVQELGSYHEQSACSDGDCGSSQRSTLRPTRPRPIANYSMAGSNHLVGFLASSPRTTFGSALHISDKRHLTTQKGRSQLQDEERCLLRDNSYVPQRTPSQEEGALRKIVSRLGQHLDARMNQKIVAKDEESTSVSTDVAEDTAIDSSSNLAEAAQCHGPLISPKAPRKEREEAMAADKIQIAWRHEAKVLRKYSQTLVATFLLQYSLTVVSIFTVGHLGKVELGAVSIASMTANITGYTIYQGLATSLDTLSAQAYGSGRRQLVGLQLQRMVYFLWLLTIPIGIVWLNSANILRWVVPEPEIAVLAGRYLKILLLGAPGYACFESGKRFVQAQGLFSATLYALLFCAPLNALMNWLFVWHFKWGFIGAPIAVVVTDNILPLCLLSYVRFVDGKDCWGGFSSMAFQRWGPMLRLALPGLLMVEAEYLAFEILTLAASYFSTTHLAAQSVLATLAAITFQLPFPISIAASTRIANLIGASLPGAAKVSAKVSLVGACLVGVFNVVLLSSLRHVIPQLFTSDDDVIVLVAEVIPVLAAFQLVDALAASCNGILRGLGRQGIGGWVCLLCYYAIAMPISMGAGFGLGWKLQGLWTGPAVGLGMVAAIEGWFICRISWEKSVEEAERRNILS